MKKNYVLDTNVLLHDPHAILKFEDNDLILPIYVLEEIDAFKRDTTERGRNARTVARLLDGGHQFRLLVRGFIGTDKGLVVLTYSLALPGTGGGTYACLRFSNGYGESLMDYNRHVSRIGIGFMFNR